MHQIVNVSALEEKEEKGSAKELLGHETKVHSTNHSNIFNHHIYPIKWIGKHQTRSENVRRFAGVPSSSYFVSRMVSSYGVFVWSLRVLHWTSLKPCWDRHRIIPLSDCHGIILPKARRKGKDGEKGEKGESQMGESPLSPLIISVYLKYLQHF